MWKDQNILFDSKCYLNNTLLDQCGLENLKKDCKKKLIEDLIECVEEERTYTILDQATLKDVVYWCRKIMAQKQPIRENDAGDGEGLFNLALRLPVPETFV